MKEPFTESSLFAQILVPILFCLLFLTGVVFSSYEEFKIFLPESSQARILIKYISSIGLWLSGGFLVNRLTRIFVWETCVAKISKATPPKLLVQLTGILIFILTIFGIMATVFNQSITGLWATSGVLGIVLGFALRSIIFDTFSGVAIQIEQPFKIGDWIHCHSRFRESFLGCVKEVNWRTTKLKSIDNNILTLPNSFISTAVLINYAHPNSQSRLSVEFCLDFSVEPDRVIRVLIAAIKSVSHIPGLYSKPAPEVLVNDISRDGVGYRLYYNIDTSKLSPRKARHFVTKSVLEHLAFAGLTLAYPKQDLFVTSMPWRQKDWHWQGDRFKLLSRVSLLKNMNREDIDFLANNLELFNFQEHDVVVHQHDPGSSMFILAEGLLDVYIEEGTSNRRTKVAQIVPGDFFGEMSLLTGEERSATIISSTESLVAKITKEHMDDLMKQSPAIGEVLSKTIAARQLENSDALVNKNNEEKEIAIQNRATKLMDQIKHFFFGS